ncbi:hypothetical protein ABZ353_31800 [Streptomyces niveus]
MRTRYSVTLHDLRHTATFRMTQDPELSMAYVQHILVVKWRVDS